MISKRITRLKARRGGKRVTGSKKEDLPVLRDRNKMTVMSGYAKC
jgi:hypothetical protein